MTQPGHEAAWREWNAARSGARMHHAWILAGKQGLGKRAFANAAARSLVGAEEGTQHPDILTLTHPPKDDKEDRKRADGKPYERARSIRIAQIREMQRRLATRPTLGERRAIVIDPADDLERNAANALLKSLEEPPQGTFFLLVSHRPARLLPTIRSRCRILRFAPVGEDAILAFLAEAAPQSDEAARRAAAAGAGGSPGAALTFIEQELAPVEELMRCLVREGDRDFALRGRLVDAIGNRPDRTRLQAIFDLSRNVLRDEAVGAQGPTLAAVADAHAAMVALAAQAPTYNFDPGFLSTEIGGLLASAAGHRSTADV
ncbi:DNA polymerase III subunit delta' [Erythrobacter sp. 3-20A1M]|uniref:DNA polymerase III subunit delta' n=1 Tax=Erythrobacter sp. 3-20A1M TaxID=2653850 RepID=UPI00204110E4|nr:DNA polymerase III subunit delta' [Erythrobacter sp. 3-20A1M]